MYSFWCEVQCIVTHFRLAQSCSHIGALLIAINNKERLQGYEENHGSSTGGGETSRTSTLCKWIVPRNVDKQEPQPISSMNMAKPKVSHKM